MKLLTNKQLTAQRAAQAQQDARVMQVQNEVAQLRAQLTPQAILTTLAEYDPRSLALLLDQMNSDILIGGETWAANLRKRAIEMMRLAVDAGGTDVQTARAINTWTSWGFGRDLQIVATDPAADVVWQECWSAPRNRPLFGTRHIHELSWQLLRDGELFFIGYASRLDGETTWRTFDTFAVKDIIHPEDDPAVNVWYVVEIDGAQYGVPDAYTWFALRDRVERAALPAGVVDINRTAKAQENGGTFTVMLAAQRQRDRHGRGWPEFYRALPWAQVYAQMLREYSAVFSAVAMFVDKVKAQGGQSTVDDIVAALQSSLVTTASEYRDTNPRPIAGSTWVENEALNRERMPLGSAAGDAQAGTMILATQMATALGVTLPDVGRPDAMQNQSVAREASRSVQQGWQRYQLFWISLWGDVAEVTLRLRAQYTGAQFASYATEISMSLPTDIDTADVVMAMKAVNESAALGTLALDAAFRANTELATLLLGDLGVKNAAELLQPTPPREVAALEAVHFHEAHSAVTVAHRCPLCGAAEAHSYAGHGPLLVCAGCGKTYNPEVE